MVKTPEDLRRIDSWIVANWRRHPILFDLFFILFAALCWMIIGG